MALALDLSDLPGGVRYIPADEWGLTDEEAARRGLHEHGPGLPEVFVHHTAGSSPSLTAPTWDDDPIRWMQWMDGLATGGGLNTTYRAAPYSWMIHKAPRRAVSIIEARGRFVPGATRGRNRTSKAICFVGNFDTRSGPAPRSPREVEITAARWLIHALKREGTLAEGATIYGHHENPSHPGATTCPGNLLIPHLPTIRAPFVRPQPQPEPAPPPATPTEGPPEMYLLSYTKTGWPSAAVFRVTGREVIHVSNGHVASADGKAAPTVTPTRAEIVAVLKDESRTHVGANPFAGDFADDELSKLW